TLEPDGRGEFRAETKQLQRRGAGVVEHQEAISDSVRSPLRVPARKGLARFAILPESVDDRIVSDFHDHSILCPGGLAPADSPSPSGFLNRGRHDPHSPVTPPAPHPAKNAVCGPRSRWKTRARAPGAPAGAPAVRFCSSFRAAKLMRLRRERYALG